MQAGKPQYVFAIARLGHNLKIRFLFQQGPQPFTHDPMIVGNQYLQTHRRPLFLAQAMAIGTVMVASVPFPGTDSSFSSPLMYSILCRALNRP